MAELETLDSPEEQRRAPKKPTPPTPKPKAEKNGEPEHDEAEAEFDEPEKKVKTTDELQKPIKAAELRTAYEKSKETIKAKDAEIAKLKTDIESAKTKPVDDPERKALATKFEASEKRRQELEKELQFVAYQKSDEFVTKYQKPFEEAWQKAATELAEFQIELEDGTMRQATTNDMMALTQMPTKEAWERAKAMFGDAAAEMMAHRRRIRDLADSQQKAIDEAQKNGAERVKTIQTQSLQQHERIGKLWQDENKVWAEKFPNWFKPQEGDEQGNALLAKGYELADAAFSSKGKDGVKKTPEEMVKIHAEVRNKAAAFPKLALKLKTARARIKELEKTVADYEASAPPAGEGGRRAPAKSDDMLGDAWSELDTLDKKR